MFRRTKHWLGLLLFWFVLAGQTWAMPCDVDADGDIDLNDLNLIQQAILARAKVSGVDDPRDPDQNGLINSIDGRLCALRCTRAKCGTVNQAPFANAGPDQTVKVGDPVVLSGAASSDPDGDPLRYTWTFSSRPPASLASLLDAATVAPRFTADKPGQYLIQLIVSDGKLNSLPDTVIISTENSRPIANAGPDQSVRVGTLVTLNGGHSTDVDGDPLTYTWQLASVPPGSGATLSNPNTVNPTLLIDQPGSYLIALTVSDGQVPSLPDTVAVTTENSPPVANAGANQSIPLGVTITLDGSRSSDVDGDPLTFRWSLLARPPGSTAVLGNPSSVSPGFNADAPGTYVAQLIVNDGNVDSAPASVTLTTANAAPIAHAGPDQSVPLGSTATLDGSASRDPEGAALSYTWSLTGRPAGSNASLSGSDTVNPSFTLDRPGNYIAQLIVSDGQLSSAPDTVTISTSNSRPVADPGAAQTVTAGTAVQLDGSASSDADGDPISFAWSLTTLPPGSTAAITPADGVSPRVIPDLAGTYIAQLIVSDGQLSSLPATVVITVSAANRKPVAVAEAIPTQTTVGSAVLLKGSASSDPDGDPLTWSWSIALRPGGSNASIASPSGAETSFVPDVPGVYTIQLVVRDGKVDSVPALVVVQVQAVNHPPVITSTAPTSATVGQAYSYPAQAIDPDLGDVLTWSLVTAPSGMTIDPAKGMIAWTPTAAGSTPVDVSVVVRDSTGLTAQQDFRIVVGPGNRAPVIAFAGFAPQWTQLAPTGTPPSPRHNYGQNNGYDAINDRLIFFGGSASYFQTPPHLNDVWVLESATASKGTPKWGQLSATGTPPAPRLLQAAVYDPTANRLIVHGGATAQLGTVLSDTWVLTNANGLGGTPEWIRLPDGEARVGHAAGYDPMANRMVVFGGHTGPVGSDRNDVRVLVDANGIGNPSWITLTTVGAAPPPRGSVTGAVYDAVSNRLIVFGGRVFRGGRERDQLFNDVWVLTNANGLGGVSEWVSISPNGVAPAPRVFHTLAFDPNSNRLAVFGGALPGATDYVGSNDTWLLTNANGLGGASEWVKLDAGSNLPLARGAAWAGYFGATNRLVVSNGSSGLPDPGLLSDAWVLASASGNCTAGQPCTFKVTASDPDAVDEVIHSLDAAPAGMMIDTASGAIVWTPTSAQIGNHAVTVRVTDRGGLFATQTFTATVAPVAVPNVVGLAPEWAESFITAADLTVGAKTSQGGAITLNFDSLPSRQGWAYEAAFNPVAEERIFSLASGRLMQNSIGIPMTGHDHNAYRMFVDISPRLPFVSEMAAAVLEEQATYSFGFCFDIETKPRIFGVGVGQSGLLAQGTPASLGSTDVAQLHTYRVSGRGGSEFTFALDGEARSSGIGSPAIPPLPASSLLFGDCTGGNNARAEVTAYSFTQPRVVGQNPPPGTLVPNKTSVDLTIVDGPATETVPNLIGLAQPAAEAAIVTANLKLGAVTSAPHPTIPAGQVSDQSPLPNIHVPKDTRVAIVMSTGPPGPTNLAPVITSAPALTATSGQPYTYQVTATDPNLGDALTFTLPTAPPGLTINAATGLITWTPTLAQAGIQNVTVRVADPGGLTAEQTFAVNVLPENRAPTAISEPFGMLRAIPFIPPFWSKTGAFTLHGSDPDGDPLTYELIDRPLYGELRGSPPALTYVPNGCFVGKDRLTFRVRDGRLDSDVATVDIHVGEDCNRNGIADSLDIASGTSQDCNGNGVPDECDVAAKGRGFSNLASWSTYDPGDHGVGKDPDGFSGGAFDGRYVYFAPYFNGSTYSGEVLRYDTQVDFGTPEAWKTYDLPTNGVGQDTRGFSGAVFDGRYVYFVPGRGQLGEVVRYDSQGDFAARTSWTAYSVQKAGVVSQPIGYVRAVFDGRYVYFVPHILQDGSMRSTGQILRLDTTQDFIERHAWSVFDPGDHGIGADADGFAGAVFDGRYLYFVPLDAVGGGAGYNGEVIRYDTQADFLQPSAWASYDSAAHGTVLDRHGYFEGTYDGRYVYFGPYMRQGVVPFTQVLRYDTQVGFHEPAAWSTFDPDAQGVGREAGSYRGVTFDCRNVYFVPFLTDYSSSPRKFHSETLRYDTNREFQNIDAWRAYNPVTAGGWSAPQGYDGAVFDGRYIYFIPTHDNVNHGTFLRYDTWTGSPDVDRNGIPDSCEARFPSITSSPMTTAVAGSAYAYDVEASHPTAGAVLTFSLTTAPAGMTINASSGLIGWTPAIGQVGSHNVEVRVTDQTGLFADQPFMITVSAPPPTNRPPTITSTAPTAATAGNPYTYGVTVTDPDSGDTLTFSLPAAPSGMTIDASTGLITWTPTPAQAGSHSVTVRVTDSGGLSADQGYTITVSAPTPTNRPPTITSTAPLAATAGNLYTYLVTATDPDAGDTLTFSLPTAPAGMSINAASGLITWTPTVAQVGNANLTVRVTDSGGLSADQGYTITVSAPGPTNRPPTITSTAPLAAIAGTPYTYAVTASDPDAGDTLTYSLTTAPAGMSIDGASGLITWTPTAAQAGDHAVEVKVQDSGGLFVTQPFTLTVTAALVCTPPPAGLVSWWPGEGNALDRAAANDGLAENGATFAAGLVGQTFRFDGNDDLIRIASGRTTSFSGPFSVELWFNPTTTIGTSTPNQMLFAKGRYLEGGFNAPVAIQVLGGDGRLLVRMPPAPALVTTTDTWPAATWQHIALSWDGARYRLYVNGLEEAQLDNAFSIVDSSDPITLGNADGFAAAGYAGLLDEVSLYNRALTAAEITALHGARALGKCTATYSRADAGPDRAVEVGNTVTLDGSASRAFDGVPLNYQWTLASRPAGSAAVLNNPGSVNPSFIADQAGSYTIDLVVTNAGRASAPDSVSITAAKVNHAPTITSSPITAATTGSTYTYPVTASDPDPGDTLTFSLPVAPAGMSINAASGLIQWTPTAGQVGSHAVTVRVQDQGGLFAPQSFLIVVVAAPVPVSVPNVVGQEQTAAQSAITAASLTTGAVTLASSDTVAAGRVISQNPTAGTVVNSGSAVALVVSSGPPGPALASIRVTPLNGLIVTGQRQAFAATGILSNGSSLPLSGVTWTSSDPAVASIDASGVASALAQGSTTISASKDGVSGTTVLGVAQSVPESTLPVAQITAPADGASIASAVPIVGTASDANFLKYLIEIAPFETGVFSTLHVGTAPVTNGTLATLDPTTLVNDLYVVRLTVIDRADNRTQTEITVQLTRDKKVGNFTLAFQDLNVPMAGIPISVVRSYDSRDKTKGDFGIGWRLDVQSLRLRVVGIHGQGWQQTQSGGVLNRRYTISPTRVHKIAITLPDGKVEEFDMGVAPSTQQFAPIQVVDAVYTPKAQTRGSLRALGETRLVTFGQTGGLDLLTESGLEIFDPQEFEYTTPEGQVILISRTAGVKQIRDRSGNTVTFAPGGITHSAGKSIVFNRDAQGRITTVTDPLGNAQTYAYDINGDLGSHTDAEGRRTGFLYNYDHGLIEIQDPRGIRPIRNDYDDAGRLIRSTDAYGKAITYTHDLGANREVITDRLGNATIHVYDDLGNVTQTADALGGVTNRSYDGRGNTLSEQDPLGRTRTYTYDGQDNRLTETDPLGATTTYTYNSNRQVLTVTDALGRTTTNAYDGAGNLSSTTDPAGKTTTYTYDARGLQTTRTDPLGNVTQYAYDASGNLTSETDPLGRVTSYTYDANGNRLTQTTSRTTASGPETLTSSFTYDKANRLTQTTHPDGSVTRVAYNAIGKQSVSTDALGRETKTEYDDMGRLTRTTYPDGTSETSAYDAEGRRTGSTDRAGRTTTSTYDALGRLVETIAPDGSRTGTTYDAAGQVLASTDARGNATTYVYDGAGRRTQVTDAAGAATLFTYDALGNQTQVTDARGNTVSFQYDANNRRTRTSYADGTFEQVAYDALGRQTAKTDQAGLTTQYDYDALGRLTSVTDALGQITRYSYDEQGNQLTQTDAEGRTTRFAYDRMGRRISRTLPLGQTETSTYDAAGNLRTKTDFNGRTTSYTYDSVNRLTRKTPDGSLGQPPVVFSYTPSGQRASMQDASGTTTYSYDNRDRLLSKATPQGTLNYSYDPAGNLTSIRSNRAGGAAMDYSYDARNRLATVTDADGRVTSYSYDQNGNLAGFLYPNGVQTTYTYNPLNRLTNVTGARGGTTIAGYTYTLGPSGNRTAVTEASGRRVDYTYDDLYRLRSETISADPAGPNGAIAYTYDRVGNRLTRVSTVAGIADQSFNYDFNDRLDGEGYDNNGNTLTSGGRTFGYDFENHLTSADGGVSFVYDGDGIRVAKTAGGVTTGFLVDDRNPTGYAQVLEEIVGGVAERSYTYGLKLISQKQASGVSFYGFDGHGSVRYLTDVSGTVTDTYAYEAFGNLVAQMGATPNFYLYAGEQVEGNVGFYYLRARYLSHNSGRFLSLDPANGPGSEPLQRHRYLYSTDDPVNKRDPTGKWTLADTGMAVSILGQLSLKAWELNRRAASGHTPTLGEALFELGTTAAGAYVGGQLASAVSNSLLKSYLSSRAFGFLVRTQMQAFLRFVISNAAGGAVGAQAQAIIQLLEFAVAGKPVTFSTASGRIFVATATGFFFGGVAAAVVPKFGAANIIGSPGAPIFETALISYSELQTSLVSHLAVGSAGSVEIILGDAIASWLGLE